MRSRVEIRNTHYNSPLARMAARRIHLLLKGSFWAYSVEKVALSGGSVIFF
jgi:hypothetical protein